jgi:hypothetical protein
MGFGLDKASLIEWITTEREWALITTVRLTSTHLNFFGAAFASRYQ